MGDGREAREGRNIHVVMADLHYLQQKPTQHYVLQLKIKKQKALQNGKKGKNSLSSCDHWGHGPRRPTIYPRSYMKFTMHNPDRMSHGSILSPPFLPFRAFNSYSLKGRVIGDPESLDSA